jgi:hypothetical protein
MDVPTRQSYVAALVKPGERTFASGITNLARNILGGRVGDRGFADAGPYFLRSLIDWRRGKGDL